MRDLIGQEIRVGDVVARGVRAGNSGAVSIGVITKIDGQNLYVDGRLCLRERTIVLDPTKIDVEASCCPRDLRAALAKRDKIVRSA